MLKVVAVAVLVLSLTDAAKRAYNSPAPAPAYGPPAAPSYGQSPAITGPEVAVEEKLIVPALRAIEQNFWEVIESNADPLDRALVALGDLQIRYLNTALEAYIATIPQQYDIYAEQLHSLQNWATGQINNIIAWVLSQTWTQIGEHIEVTGAVTVTITTALLQAGHDVNQESATGVATASENLATTAANNIADAGNILGAELVSLATIANAKLDNVRNTLVNAVDQINEIIEAVEYNVPAALQLKLATIDVNAATITIVNAVGAGISQAVGTLVTLVFQALTNVRVTELQALKQAIVRSQMDQPANY